MRTSTKHWIMCTWLVVVDPELFFGAKTEEVATKHHRSHRLNLGRPRDEKPHHSQLPNIMAAIAPSRLTILHAYRSLLRAGLVAVQYSTPARYAIRDKLRTAFRERPPTSFNQSRINNTLEFLGAAGQRVGTEHQIVRNLCFVHYWQTHHKFRR